MSTAARTLRDRVTALIERADGVAPIVALGAPVLRQPAEPVDGQLDDELLRAFVELLRRTMQQAPGVGLAAPQVGVPLQLAVLEDPATVPAEVGRARQRSPLEFLAVANPRYTAAGETVGFYEGCLSMPGYTAVVNRPLSVDATYTDLSGAPRNLRLTGWPARIFQHETDHLNGTVYVDKLEPRSLSTTQNYLELWDDPVPSRAAAELDFRLDPA